MARSSREKPVEPHTCRQVQFGDAPGTTHFEMIPALNVEEGFNRLYEEAIEDMAAFLDQYGMDLVGPPLEE